MGLSMPLLLNPATSPGGRGCCRGRQRKPCAALLIGCSKPPNAFPFIVSQTDGGPHPTAGSVTGGPDAPEFLSHFGPQLQELGHVLTPSITERIRPFSSRKARPRCIFSVYCPLENTGAGKDGDFCTGKHSSCPAGHPRHRHSLSTQGSLTPTWRLSSLHILYGLLMAFLAPFEFY